MTSDSILPNGDLQGQFSKDVEFRPHTHQVAGHRPQNGRAKFAMLHGRTGRVLKPFQDHDRGKTELNFYRTIFEELKWENVRPFLPNYFGLLDHGGKLYLELEDLTHGFEEPCIVDIKIGKLLYGPEKIATDLERIEKKYPLARHIGYQILGMKTYCPSTKLYKFHDKIYFREQLNLDNVKEGGLGLFFQCYDSTTKVIVAAILKKLECILDWFSEQKSFVFYGSSLLITYEGGIFNDCSIHGSGSKNGDSLDKKKNYKEPLVDVRMIDFTHVLPSAKLDENYLYGLRFLVAHLRSFVEN